MFQLEEDEFDLNEEFLEDIFQLTGPQRNANNGNQANKSSENDKIEFSAHGNGDGKNSLTAGSPLQNSSSSNSSPVTKKAKFPCDSDQRLLPFEGFFLQSRIEEQSTIYSKNLEFQTKDLDIDPTNSEKLEKNKYHGISLHPAESQKLSLKLSSNQIENCRMQDLNAGSFNVRRRKFPGPAGLLPELDKRKCYPDLSQVPVDNVDGKGIFLNQDSQGESETALSQPCAVGSLFGNNTPWSSLRQDLGLNNVDAHRNPLTKICLKWARQKATARLLPAHKVPFLAVAIHALDCSSPDPCVILRDPTGEMGGTLHREVWERHGYLLHPGAAMALRQVGVLSTGAAARRHYLNITENNLLSIYSSAKMKNGPFTFVKGDEMFSSEIKITKIRPLDINEVKQSLTEMQNMSHSPVSTNVSPSSSSLYSSFSSGPRPHISVNNSARSSPYRAAFSSNLNRFGSQRPSNLSPGQCFSSGVRNPNQSHINSFVSNPVQSSSWSPMANAVSMDVQCSNSPPSSTYTSAFTPKRTVSSASCMGSFVPKQPFLSKFQIGPLGSPSVPYHSVSSLAPGASSSNISLSSQECSTAMDVSVEPCIPICEKSTMLNPSGPLERKGMTNITGAECAKNQALEEAELDSILGGIDTDLLFDDDEF